MSLNLPFSLNILSDAEIDQLVSQYEVEDLDSTQAWMTYYDKLAAKIKSRYTSGRIMKLDFDRIVKVALQKKYDDMRFGLGRFAARVGTMALSVIPTGKMIFMTGSTIAFADRSLKQFGMGEHTDVVRYHREACSKGGVITSVADFKKHLHEELPKKFLKESAKAIWEDPTFHQQFMDFLNEEFGKEAVVHASHEVVHFKPKVGQVISAVIGWRSFGKQTQKALDHVRDVATAYHTKVLGTIAVVNNAPPPPRRLVTPGPHRTNDNSWGSWLSDNAAGVGGSLAIAYLTGRTIHPSAVQSAWNAWSGRR
ncbi:hypothetical protein NLJ89_g349 [Agrocybe chaxingu]|uniref:Uncharacterized protein n=1 Tax=Agrocybe chaxingu TaxID=84603 RepID=A0A9W8N240_9AGAR|nr:hypothetical protein NLJ89_g349 [Agrocybe chaxingu]